MVLHDKFYQRQLYSVLIIFTSTLGLVKPQGDKANTYALTITFDTVI